MPPLRGAKINSGFLLVRRRFDLLLFRGAQLIATMHTYFCSRPRKIAAATFTHPSTNPPRFFSLRVHCAHCTTCSLNACTHCAPTLSLSLSLPRSPIPLLPVFPFAPLLLRGKLAAIAVARFSRNRDYQPRNHVLLDLRVIYSYYLATSGTFLPALSSLRYCMY